MRFMVSRTAWIFMILSFGMFAQSMLPAQQEVEACCNCVEPQFDLDCNYVCPDAPYCECGSPYCAADGSGWICPEAPQCAPGYEPACSNGQWTCEYAGSSSTGGGGSCDPYCFCPWFDAFCELCPYYDPYCEYCDYDWDPYCYDCDSCDPSCGSYYQYYWNCAI